MHGNSRHRSSRPVPPGQSGTAGGTGPFADTERIASLLEPAVSAMGMDLENVRITWAGRRRLLRVVIDADGGVSLDDIALVSRELSGVLDQAAAMGEAPYTLEVSSPGVDRPLTQPKHWRRAVGRLVTAPLRPERPSAGGSGSSPRAGTAKGSGGSSPRAGTAGDAAGAPEVAGRVAAADAQGVTIEAGGVRRRFGYAELGPGRIQIEFARVRADDGNGGGAGKEEVGDGY